MSSSESIMESLLKQILDVLLRVETRMNPNDATNPRPPPASTSDHTQPELTLAESQPSTAPGNNHFDATNTIIPQLNQKIRNLIEILDPAGNVQRNPNITVNSHGFTPKNDYWRRISQRTLDATNNNMIQQRDYEAIAHCANGYILQLLAAIKRMHQKCGASTARLERQVDKLLADAESLGGNGWVKQTEEEQSSFKASHDADAAHEAREEELGEWEERLKDLEGRLQVREQDLDAREQDLTSREEAVRLAAAENEGMQTALFDHDHTENSEPPTDVYDSQSHDGIPNPIEDEHNRTTRTLSSATHSTTSPHNDPQMRNRWKLRDEAAKKKYLKDLEFAAQHDLEAARTLEALKASMKAEKDALALAITAETAKNEEADSDASPTSGEAKNTLGEGSDVVAGRLEAPEAGIETSQEMVAQEIAQQDVKQEMIEQIEGGLEERQAEEEGAS